MKWFLKGLLLVASLALIIGGFVMSGGKPDGLNKHPLMPLKIFLIFLGFVLLVVFVLLMVWPLIKRSSVEQIKNQERKNNPKIDLMSDDEIIEKYGDIEDEDDMPNENLEEDVEEDLEEDFLDEEETEEFEDLDEKLEDEEDDIDEEEIEDVEDEEDFDEELDESEEETSNETSKLENKQANICEYCGTENKDNAKFCSACGANLKNKK